MSKPRARGGIRAVVLRRARISEIPTKLGPCEQDGRPGHVRYMVAAKLPRPFYWCNDHYLPIRDALEKALTEILKGIEL